MRAAFRPLVAIAATLLLGLLSGLATNASLASWYAGLEKPSWTPPNAVFGPAWTVLYVLMGLAAGLVWNAGTGRPEVRQALKAYGVQLVLNVLWTLLFFGARSPLAALVDIALLVPAVAVCMRLMWPVRRASTWLMAPYLLWVGFAALLNAAIVTLN